MVFIKSFSSGAMKKTVEGSAWLPTKNESPRDISYYYHL